MKNKEIEYLLKGMRDVSNTEGCSMNLDRYLVKLLLSYIEQLDTNYKEANESVTWWQNRYNAIVKQNDDNHKKVVKLENNRDKAIEILDRMYTDFEVMDSYNILSGDKEKLINILKGDSDE